MVEVIYGDAVEVVPPLGEVFDFIFLDTDKGDYTHLFEPCLDHLRRGGILAADNAGMVRRYNEMAREDGRVETIIVPIGDGITLSVRL